MTLRPVTDNDREFLLNVYAASREFELSMMGADESIKRIFIEHQFDAQGRHYREYYPEATHEIILQDGEAVGRLYVNRGETEIAILDITVLPNWRKKGIATSIVRELQDEAGESGRLLRVYVEDFNPSQKFFRDLGFEAVTKADGRVRFEWRALC